MMILDRLLSDYREADKQNNQQKKYIVQEVRMSVMVEKKNGNYEGDKNINELLTKIKNRKLYELAFEEMNKDSKRVETLHEDIQYLDTLIENYKNI